MDEKKTNRRTMRVLDVIAAILIIFAAMLTYMHHHVDFESITEPFERLSSMAQEQFTGTSSTEEEEAEESTETPTVVSNITQTAEQMRDDLGITKAQMNYIKFKNFMENLETRVTELPYKPLIVLALLLLFALKSFVGIVPVSATCLIAAVIFPFPVALIINIIGVGIIFTIKFFMGRSAKSNAFKKLIMRSDNLWKVVSDADNSTSRILGETAEERIAARQARLDEKAAKKAERAAAREEKYAGKEPHPVLEFIRAIPGNIKAFLGKIPVLKIIVGDEDSEKVAEGGTGNPIILFVLRLIPFVPANPVSTLFGNLQMNYRIFLLISIIGYLLKVTSFTAIGYNIADPFSSKFIVPLIVLLYIAGVSLFGAHAILNYVEKRKAAEPKTPSEPPAAVTE